MYCVRAQQFLMIVVYCVRAQQSLMVIHWRVTTSYHTLVSVSCTSECSFVVGCDVSSAALQDVIEDSLAQAASRREL